VITKAIEVIRLLLKPSRLVDLLHDEIAKLTGDNFATAVTAVFKVLAAFLDALLAPANLLINGVISAVEAAFEAFLKTISRGLIHRAKRVLPQWVPVDPAQTNHASVDRAQVIEVEGTCTRSFGNPVDVPLAQWHTWFAWNVQLALEPEYARARSPSGDAPNVDDPSADADDAAAQRSIIRPGSFEVQWDAGALLGAERAAFEAKIADSDTPLHDGPMTLAAKAVSKPDVGSELDAAFLWPMPGMFVWACGRHVYDCSRVTHKPRKGKDPVVEADPPLMPAMIQPARALATANRQAFQFRENGNFFVPSIQFMFIACRRGGYIDHDTLADEDYVFVIDLPDAPSSPASPYPVGDTVKVPHNTVVVRPRLLKFLRFLPRIDGKESIDPVLEIIAPGDPAAAPRQVRLTIPKAILDGADAYGFTLALGWHDPRNHELARRVMLCELELRSLQMRLSQRDDPAAKLRRLFSEQEGDLKKIIAEKLKNFELDLPLVVCVKPLSIPGISSLVDSVVAKALATFNDELVKILPSEGEEEWLFRVGVNGVWVSFFFKPAKHETKTFDADEMTFKFALAKGDELLFSCHGTEFDPIGDMMHAARAKRTLRVDGNAPRWPQIVKPKDQAERDRLLFALMRALMFDTTEGVSKVSLGFDNQPLGLLDPEPGNRGPSQQHDPMVIDAPFEDTLRAQRLGRFAHAIAPEMILAEDTRDAPVTLFPVKPDYDLRYTLKVKAQVADEPPAP
jgi:hypothetical protein